MSQSACSRKADFVRLGDITGGGSSGRVKGDAQIELVPLLLSHPGRGLGTAFVFPGPPDAHLQVSLLPGYGQRVFRT